MLIDCFTFFNECNLLESRLEYLYDSVDYFVIAEGNKTFAGNSKPYYYLENQNRYSKYEDKILYLPVNINIDTNDPWKREEFQRNSLAKIIKLFPRNTTVLLGDLDEIPLVDAIQKVSFSILGMQEVIATFGMYMFNCNFNYRQTGLWPGTVIFKSEDIINRHTLEAIRKSRTSYQKLHYSGYHLSYWNSIDDVVNKIKEFSHQEFNTEKHTNKEALLNQLKIGKDLLQRDHVNIEKVDRSTIDPEILRIFGKYEITGM